MKEAKDTDDSLEFLRSFEKYATNTELGELVFQRLDRHNKSLNLQGNRFTETEFQNLFALESIKYLKSIDLSETGMNSKAIKHLCSSKWLKHTTSLSLSNNNLDDEGIFLLSKTNCLPQLTSLDLSSNEIGALGAKVLSLSKSLNSICSLNISYNRIEPLGVHSLANSDFGRQLKFLQLRDTCLGNEGMRGFSSFRLDDLESLDLSDNAISDAGLETLATSNSFPNIKKLVLNNNHIGDDGIYGNTNGRLISSKNTFGIDPLDAYGQDDILVRDNKVHLPINKPVVFQLRSKDVLHDFYIPQFRAKMDLVPGSQTNLWFIPTELGTYEVACAEFCGTGHWAMRGEITVDEMADFEAWLSQHPTFVETMNEGSEGRGRQIVQSLGCVACHSDDGTTRIGPTWRGSFGSQQTLVNGETMNIDEAYIKKSIVNPSIQIAAGFASIMPAYNLSEDELDAIVEYMKNLSIE